ncbi:MAG: TetR family transcriptional regulator [Rubrivivax sp.]|nr:TetR family transcriptional regulator [Rubrivivax sp.]
MARKTKTDAQVTRSSILDAAELLFQARGVSRTTLHDIASAAGVTRGAVYWHFKDKSDLFNAMMDRVILPMEQAAEGLVVDNGHPVLPALRALLLGVFAHVTEDDHVRRVLEIALHKTENVDELSAVRARRLQMRLGFRARLQRTLRRGQAQGEVDAELPAVQLAISLHALLDGLIQDWLFDTESFDLQVVGAQAVDVHLAGMAPPRPVTQAKASPRTDSRRGAGSSGRSPPRR